MSANTIIDIGNTTLSQPSITVSGSAFLASGVAGNGYVGTGVDGLHADNFCNLYVAGQAYFTSGQLRIAVQCSDTDVSGSYTDPTSGLPVLPTSFSSGGVLILNSGGLGTGLLGAGASGQFILSGFNVFAGFQRNARFVRAWALSGTSDFYAGVLTAGFVTQLRTTGSGGGYTLSPTSGTVNV